MEIRVSVGFRVQFTMAGLHLPHVKLSFLWVLSCLQKLGSDKFAFDFFFGCLMNCLCSSSCDVISISLPWAPTQERDS